MRCTLHDKWEVAAERGECSGEGADMDKFVRFTRNYSRNAVIKHVTVLGEQGVASNSPNLKREQ